MLSIDIYVNETTRHADVILPAPGPLEKSHYDLALYQLAARNVANYSPAILESELPAEWGTLARLTGIVSGQGPDADVDAVDAMVIGAMVAARGRRPALADRRPRPGRDPGRARAAAAGPSGCSTCCCAWAPTATRFGDDPDGPDAGACSRRTRTAWTSGRWSRASPTCCAPPSGQGRAGAASRSWPTCRGCASRWRPPPRRWCWSAAASCARTTRGCTTSSRW